MQIKINGSLLDIDDGTTVAGLVAAHQLQPRHVAVEVNTRLVPRRDFDDTALQAGDEVEIVTLVGGG